MHEELKWETLERKTVLRDPWIQVEASRCRLPGGAEIFPFYVNRARDFAVVVAVTEDGMVLIEYQYRHGIEAVIPELPAGMIEKGEEPLAAARRELLEETGYKAPEWEFLFKVAPNASSCTHMAWCYLAKGAAPAAAPQPEATEALAVEQVPLRELRAMLARGVFPQAVHVSALYRALDRLGA